MICLLFGVAIWLIVPIYKRWEINNHAVTTVDQNLSSHELWLSYERRSRLSRKKNGRGGKGKDKYGENEDETEDDPSISRPGQPRTAVANGNEEEEGQDGAGSRLQPHDTMRSGGQSNRDDQDPRTSGALSFNRGANPDSGSSAPQQAPQPTTEELNSKIRQLDWEIETIDLAQTALNQHMRKWWQDTEKRDEISKTMKTNRDKKLQAMEEKSLLLQQRAKIEAGDAHNGQKTASALIRNYPPAKPELKTRVDNGVAQVMPITPQQKDRIAGDIDRFVAENRATLSLDNKEIIVNSDKFYSLIEQASKSAGIFVEGRRRNTLFGQRMLWGLIVQKFNEPSEQQRVPPAGSTGGILEGNTRWCKSCAIDRVKAKVL